MGRATAKDVTGDLVLTLTPVQLNEYKGVRGAPPQAGSIANLWRLPGRWAVWSEGPNVGTWWLNPHDETAREVGRQIAEKPARGAPVVVAVWKSAIAVQSKDIKPGGW